MTTLTKSYNFSGQEFTLLWDDQATSATVHIADKSRAGMTVSVRPDGQFGTAAGGSKRYATFTQAIDAACEQILQSPTDQEREDQRRKGIEDIRQEWDKL